MDYLLLSFVTFAPALAALILLIVARGDDADANRVAKRFALSATTFTFVMSLFIVAQFDPSDMSYRWCGLMALGSLPTWFRHVLRVKSIETLICPNFQSVPRLQEKIRPIAANTNIIGYLRCKETEMA